MPAEERDLAVLRGLYAKWAVGDFDSVEEFAEDVVWIPVDLIGGGEFRGIDELSEQWRGWLQTFSDGFRIEADEIISRGGGRYVVMQTFRGIGRVSGVETVGHTVLVITMRDGRIARMEGFWDRDQGLAAAGLEG